MAHLRAAAPSDNATPATQGRWSGKDNLAGDAKLPAQPFLSGNLGLKVTKDMVNCLPKPIVLNPTLTPSSPPPTPNKRLCTYQQPYSPGKLGKLALRNAKELARLGWHHFFLRKRTPTSIWGCTFMFCFCVLLVLLSVSSDKRN